MPSHGQEHGLGTPFEAIASGKSAADTTREASRRRLLVVVNSWLAVRFVQGQLEYFQGQGFDVTLISPDRRKDEWPVARPQRIPVIEMPMERRIAPLQDLICLWRLWRTMRRIRPSVTNVGTPKAGLLGGFAAWLNRVPCRFYTLHGLRFETTRGLKRRLLIYAERLACFFAHRVVCVSYSVREKVLANRLAHEDRAMVFGAGSCNGVDVLKFAATPENMRRGSQLRRQMNLPEDVRVLTFVGRLTRDKGIPELLDAFSRLDKMFPNLRLVLVGCHEDEDPLPTHTRELLQTHPHIIFAGSTSDTPAYYAMADVVVLPSHREGLPTVILEAQAACKPVVGASATGIVDVIADGQTGLLFPIGDVAALTAALARLITDKQLATKLAFAGQEQVRRRFQQEQVWEALHDAYLKVLRPKEPPVSFASYREKSGDLLRESGD